MLAITATNAPVIVWIWAGLLIFVLVCMFAAGFCRAAKMGDEMMDKHRDQ